MIKKAFYTNIFQQSPLSTAHNSIVNINHTKFQVKIWLITTCHTTDLLIHSHTWNLCCNSLLLSLVPFSFGLIKYSELDCPLESMNKTKG